MSDLHLEFKQPPLVIPPGDILVLAGDITNAALSGLVNFDSICEGFKRVLMVMGNHEHYGGNFSSTYMVLKTVLPNNVILLENESVHIDRQSFVPTKHATKNTVHFVGCSLWTNMNEVDQSIALRRMNDYVVIEKGVSNALLLPSDTVNAHKKSAKFLKESITENSVVITHHAPSFKSCSGRYVGDTAYASDLSSMILDKKPKYWIHGHIHETANYFIGETNVVSNPKGYPHEKNNPNFSTNATLEI